MFVMQCNAFIHKLKHILVRVGSDCLLLHTAQQTVHLLLFTCFSFCFCPFIAPLWAPFTRCLNWPAAFALFLNHIKDFTRIWVICKCCYSNNSNKRRKIWKYIDKGTILFNCPNTRTTQMNWYQIHCTSTSVATLISYGCCEFMHILQLMQTYQFYQPSLSMLPLACIQV